MSLFLGWQMLPMCSRLTCVDSVNRTSTRRIPKKSIRHTDRHAPLPGKPPQGPVVAGYDVGGAVSQMRAARRPDLVKALVVSPHLPGAGKRVLELGPAREF